MLAQVMFCPKMIVTATIIIKFFLLSSFEATELPPCNRTCGTQTKVQYPFGFSLGCEIELSCANNANIQIGDFHVQNVTSDSIFVNLPGKCNRPIEIIKQLIGKNYAPTSRNNYLLQNCTSPVEGCVIAGSSLRDSLEVEGCKSMSGKMSCYREEDIGVEFTTYEALEKTYCSFLFSSIAVGFGENQSTKSSVDISIQTVELGWFMQGKCECVMEAVCTPVSIFGGQEGFRCRCKTGFKGDGFVAGIGCWNSVEAGEKRNLGQIIGIATGVVGGSILLLSVIINYYRRMKTGHGSSLFSPNVSSYSKDVEDFIGQYGSSIPKRFKYSTIKKITNSFKDELGKGGYGNVYRGVLADGRVVAVKVLNATKGKGEEFVNEVASIGRTSHVNIVTLLGFCYEGKRRALIYEFMPNGSLEKFIYGTTLLLEGQHLGWERLYSIAIGIARGLEYLHQGCNTRILHFDIKPHNILLDKNFCPKISDFGLSKLYTTSESGVSSLLQARGTIGYISPEVISRNFGQVSPKSDVYSYGMMILEMVGGRKNVNAGADNTSEIYYPRWLYKRIQFDDVLDLASEISVEDNERARKMVIVGLWCIQTYPTQRPSIAKVIEMLEGKIAALEIPPNPYLCSAPNSPSYSQTKPSGTESASSP